MAILLFIGDNVANKFQIYLRMRCIRSTSTLEIWKKIIACDNEVYLFKKIGSKLIMFFHVFEIFGST